MNVRILVFIDSNLAYSRAALVILFPKATMKAYLLARSKKREFYIIETDGRAECHQQYVLVSEKSVIVKSQLPKPAIKRCLPMLSTMSTCHGKGHQKRTISRSSFQLIE